MALKPELDWVDRKKIMFNVSSISNDKVSYEADGILYISGSNSKVLTFIMGNKEYEKDFDWL